MRLDRGEAGGTGLALLLHLALIAALATSLAHTPKAPEPAPVTVEFVDSDEVALTAAAPAPATPPPAAMAPATPPEAVPEPTPAPTPAPAPPSPAAVTPPPPRPNAAPAPPVVRQPTPRPPRPAPPRTSRLGDDFLAGLPTPDRDLGPRPATPGAATFSAAAKASVDGAIKRQIQPCADRQNTLGPEADGIRVTVNLRLDRSGRLSRPPSFVRSNATGDNKRFEDLAYDQAVAVFRQCAPLRLPPELYITPQGGWANINLTYAAK